jgi:hypothetical protein
MTFHKILITLLMESIMARIKINDIESASFASESYLNDLQELEMTSVKGGWGWAWKVVRWVAVAVVTALLSSSSEQSPSQPQPSPEGNSGGGGRGSANFNIALH